MSKDNVTVAKHRSPYVYLAGLLLALASCQQVDAAANLSDNASVAVNPAAGNASPNTKADTAARAVFLCPSNATRAPFSMVGRGGEPSGCRFLSAGLANPAMCLPPRMQAGWGSKPTKEATMPKFARALSRIFTAAHQVAHFPTESEAVTFARQYLAQTGRAVAVAPAAIGFDVIGGVL